MPIDNPSHETGGAAASADADRPGIEPVFISPRAVEGVYTPVPVQAAPPTILDLARELGISSTTVWRALNDSPRVSAKTRERVLRAAERMNYRPSLVAQTLLRGKTQTLGVVVPMIGNPVYASLVRAVEQVAFHHKYNIILCDTDFQLEREREYVDLLTRRRVEGVAVIPFAARSGINGDDYAHLTRLPQQGVAVVAMQQDVPGGLIDAVLPDNRAAARAMTEHLLALGHRRIGFLHGGMPEWNVPMRERFDGYRDALVGVNVPFDGSLVMQAGTFESVLTDGRGRVHVEEIAAYLNRPDRPTALFVPVDMLAIKVMEVARDQLGLRVPEDVAIAGFDDIGAAAHTSPPLTTVRHPTAEVGRRAAELLFERAAGASARPRTRVHERIECKLVIRRSCGGGGVGAAVAGG